MYFREVSGPIFVLRSFQPTSALSKMVKLWTGLLILHQLTAILALSHDRSSPCAKIPVTHLPGADVLSVVGVELHNVSLSPMPGAPTLPSNLSVCEVNVTLSHPGLNGSILVQTWLPLSDWNGRFQGTGGGGLATGSGAFPLGLAAQLGYSASQTDGGHLGGAADWALLNDTGQVNYDLLIDFASRSLHDMAVVGKQVTARYYGRPPERSYWNGCSTGGRQGHMGAQRYPTDYDGILADAPAINWDRFVAAEIWPQVVMYNSKTYPTACEFSAFQSASIAACDGLDRALDGLISNTDACSKYFNPYSLVGTTPPCSSRPITPAVAKVVQKIHNGARSRSGEFQWYGLEWGTPFTALAKSTMSPNGIIKGVPFFVSDLWIAYWLRQNPDLDTTTLSYEQWDTIFADSMAGYNSIIGTDKPDLSAFRDHGGKMITWHGLSDDLIFPKGTIDYRRRVEAAMGGNSAVNQFYRTFLAPGVGHCMGGTGPAPVDPLNALVRWVEEGIAPDMLYAENSDGSMRRNLCPWPLLSKYEGGDVNKVESFTCAESY